MRAILICLVGVLWAGLLGGFMRRQWDIQKFGLGELFKHPETVPLIVLSFGPFIFLAILSIVWIHMRVVPSTLQAFPTLFGTEHPNDASRLISEEISAATVLLVLPLCFLWFWYEFFEQRVFMKEGIDRIQIFATQLDMCRMYRNETLLFSTSPGEEVNPWSPVDLCLAWRGWDIYRYGGDGNASSDSFLPFWQPVFIMLLPYSFGIVWAGHLYWTFRRRLDQLVAGR